MNSDGVRNYCGAQVSEEAAARCSSDILSRVNPL